MIKISWYIQSQSVHVTYFCVPFFVSYDSSSLLTPWCPLFQLLALHAVVGTLLLGIVILVVGVVQLSPGAEAAQHRYYLMGTGAILMSTGVLGCILRYQADMERWEAKLRNSTRATKPTTN